MQRTVIAGALEAALRKSLDAPKLRLLALEGERPAIDETRAPWIAIKYGPASTDEWFGLVPARAHFERAPRSGKRALGADCQGQSARRPRPHAHSLDRQPSRDRARPAVSGLSGGCGIRSNRRARIRRLRPCCRACAAWLRPAPLLRQHDGRSNRRACPVSRIGRGPAS